MAQYYGVERSDEYLAHYGVRGMKWGVRKAIERGDRAAVSKHYQKAQAKLQKLSEEARTGRGIAARRVRRGAASSALLSGVGTYALNRIQGAGRAQSAIAAGTAALIGGAGGAAINAGKATNAEKRMAAARRDAWKREMDSTFKGSKKKLKNNRNGNSSTNGFEAGLKKTSTRAGLIGGGVGAGVATARYLKAHPKEYDAYKKRLKKMSTGQRIRTIWKSV